VITDRAVALEAAYARCEEITNTEARNFSYGIRLLPTEPRRAMSALYAMARRIDDVGDGDLPPDQKVAALKDVRLSLGRVRDGDPPPDDPVLLALTDAAARFPIPLAAFDEVVEGCEMDATGFRYETADELVGYCRRVAGSIGRLSLGVFGLTGGEATRPVAERRADDLGIALQLTNILRDVVEDRGMGRVYLPAEDRRRFRCDDDLTGPRDAVGALVRFEADRARAWFTDGLQLLPMLDRRSRACVAAMAGIYRRLLERIARQPDAVLDGRLSVPGWEKAWVAARSLAGVRP
jgi:15-cis-phytoene synthase